MEEGGVDLGNPRQRTLSLVGLGTGSRDESTGFVAMIFDILAQGLFFGTILWLVYLAIEPSLRARWPRSIVTWNRLLAGQWGDPLVWSHVLIGGAAGLLLMMAVLAAEGLRLGTQGPGAGGWNSELLGTRRWFGGICSSLVGW